MVRRAVNLKAGLKHGAQRAIAGKLGVSEAYVSMVVTGKRRATTERGRRKEREIKVAVARALRLRVDEAFPQTRAA